MNKKRQQVSTGKRWVIKVGSSLITQNGRGLNMDVIANLASQLAALVASGKEVILVSSGAIAEGMNRLGWQILAARRPESAATSGEAT